MIHVFDESTPLTAKSLRKYQLYSALRKERGKFLKSIKPGWYGEWVIHKKLIDAGGLGDTVYIVPARANNKVYTQLELYKELFAQGRDIKVVTAKKPEPSFRSDNIEKIKELYIDWDLYCNQDHHAIYEEMDKHIHELILQRFREDSVKNWITTTWPDAYIFDHKTYTDYAMRDFLFNPKYGIVYRKDDPIIGGVTCP